MASNLALCRPPGSRLCAPSSSGRAPAHGRRRRCARSLADDEQQWAAELEILRRRRMQPNQLEALARAEATSEIGRVRLPLACACPGAHAHRRLR